MSSTIAPLTVTVWGENIHEREHDAVREVYPNGMHTVIAEGLREKLGERVLVRTATLDQPEHGLSEAVLAETSVLTWWGHMGHHLVDDAIVERVQKRVLEGMGLIVLHSGHYSKIFRKLLGTGCGLRWREAHEREILWNVNPGHAITQGVGSCLILDHHEMYSEYFDVPPPDELLFISSFAGGEVFRSGMTFRRGLGKIFYFSPGHETYPIYYRDDIRHVLANAILWAAPTPPSDPTLFAGAPQSHPGWFER